MEVGANGHMAPFRVLRYKPSLGSWVRFGIKRSPRGPSGISNCRQTGMFLVKFNSSKRSFESESYPTKPCWLYFSAHEASPKNKFFSKSSNQHYFRHIGDGHSAYGTKRSYATQIFLH